MSHGHSSRTLPPNDHGTLRTKVDRPPRSGSADHDDRFPPGRVIADRYRVISTLGQGGMGEVYRADDLVLDQAVALKFLPETLTGDPERHERFLEEVRLARQITHPNVCRIYDVITAEEQIFLSMEYIDGEDLAALLRRIGRLPEDKAVALGLDLCAGLHAIHERGILHRDLKPSNLMIDGRGQARIADFGLAGWAGTEVLGGTLSYMSPEQIMGLGVTIASDLYALGLVLYEIITGKRAFEGPRLTSLARRPVSPSKLVRDLDPRLEGVILRCLEKDPRDRPASVSAIAAGLRHGSVDGWRPAPEREIPNRPHWVLREKIGEGSSGQVWLAVHRKTRDRRVFKFCEELPQLRALQREVTLFRLLKEELGDRDDINRILDWSFEEPPYFVESEYASGGNLLAWAEERGGIGAVPLKERLEIVAKMALALAAAHAVGVLHKDVKPTNVLIAHTADGAARIRLSDFGVGALTERHRLAAAGITALGITEREASRAPLAGTRIYMAPEILEGKAATVQADIYALGVVLYQMVVADFSRVLTPNWQRDVDDELLSCDIAAAVDGSLERRLGSARQLARRLRSLDARRAERRARQRGRRILRMSSLALGLLFFFTAGLALHSRQVAREEARTRNLARVTLAGEWLSKDPTSAALVLLEVDRPEKTAFAVTRMREVLYEEIATGEIKLHETLLAAALSPSGEHLAVLSEVGHAWLWKLEGGDAPRALQGHDGPVTDIAWSPDGRRLVTSSEDGSARLWHLESGGELFPLKDGHGPLISTSWSPDGDRLLFVSEDCVQIWADRAGENPLAVLERRERPFLSSASFSPDGASVVVVNDVVHSVEIWRPGAARTELLGRHEEPVLSAVFSPEGDRVLTASENNTARIWHLPDDGGREPLVFRGHRGRVASALFSPSGERVVTASTDGTARIWNADGTGTPRVFKTDEALIAAGLDRRERRLVTASREGTLRLWDLRGPNVFFELLHEGPVSDASFSPSGEHVLTSSKDGTVRLWDISNGAKTSDGRLAEPLVLDDLRDVMQVIEASFSVDGAHILAIYEDLTVRRWASDGSGTSLFFEHHLDKSLASNVSFSPAGNRLVSTPWDGEIQIWSLEDPKEPTVLAGHPSHIEDVTFSPDGRRVASASWDRTVRVWRADAVGEPYIFEHGSRVYAVSFSPRGDRLATASADGRVRIWDLAGGYETSIFRHDRLVRAPLFSPDGERIATVSLDGTARVGPTSSQGRPFFLKGHTSSVVNAAWSPDGARIVTASRDGTARVWRADGTGEAIVLRHADTVAAASWSPDGRRVVTASDDGTARVWRLLEASEILEEIRAMTDVCLDAAFREEILGDPPEDAERRYRQCRSSEPRASPSRVSLKR